jgi:hypothetical protein
MIRRIVIEVESPNDSIRGVFRLSIDATLIAKGVTAAQAHLLVGEILGALPNESEMVTFDPTLETAR